MKEMASMIGYNMIFHVSYRSYTDGRTGDDFSQNSTMKDRVDVIKCSLHSLVFEINEVNAVYKQNDVNYELSEVDILGIQNVLLSGNYNFSPLRIVLGNGVSSGSNSTPMLSVEASLADEVVIGALSGILIKELRRSCYFRQSCYSTYTKDRSFPHYLDTIQEWREMDSLLRVDCSNSAIYFSRSRLIEKVRPIVHNDDDLVKLISSFCNMPYVDNKGRPFSLNTGVPPLSLISEILFNIILDDIDQEIEVQLPKHKYARYQDEIFIPIYEKDKEEYYYKALNEIFKKCNLLSPTLERAVRGGGPIRFSGGSILINNEGKSEIEYNTQAKEVILKYSF